MKSVISRLLIIGLVLLGGNAIAGDSFPKWPEPKGEKCVEPTDVMRREHMDFILHQRDETMHKGIRGAKHSLKDCIDCHVGYDDNGKALPINAKGQFCESCHTYAAVSIDCFACHRTTPMNGSKMSKSAQSLPAGHPAIGMSGPGQ
jgi:nitrate/TMAO reductase-like tetraheme cytochrome c subunit